MNRYEKQRKKHGRDKRKVKRPFHKKRRGATGKVGTQKESG